MKKKDLRKDSAGVVKGDRALRTGDADRLGFREVAARIATALSDHASNDGLVIGLDGKWGSGKSSLLYLIEEELGEAPEIRATNGDQLPPLACRQSRCSLD